MNKRFGFTLSEVLITLGIIGVVAALTIPTLVQKYQIKALQVAFNRMDKQIREALVELQYENNTDDFFALASKAGAFENLTDGAYKTQFYKKFNIVKTFKYDPPSLSGVCPQNYIGDHPNCYVNGFYLIPDQILKDGATIFYLTNSWQVYLCFDTNGPYKGPNRLGYDVFIIITTTDKNLGEQQKTLERCSINSTNDKNGWSCYYYAKNDINPDDSTKGYWESLKF